jgi:hypothetical protein
VDHDDIPRSGPHAAAVVHRGPNRPVRTIPDLLQPFGPNPHRDTEGGGRDGSGPTHSGPDPTSLVHHGPRTKTAAVDIANPAVDRPPDRTPTLVHHGPSDVGQPPSWTNVQTNWYLDQIGPTSTVDQTSCRWSEASDQPGSDHESAVHAVVHTPRTPSSHAGPQLDQPRQPRRTRRGPGGQSGWTTRCRRSNQGSAGSWTHGPVTTADDADIGPPRSGPAPLSAGPRGRPDAPRQVGRARAAVVSADVGNSAGHVRLSTWSPHPLWPGSAEEQTGQRRSPGSGTQPRSARSMQPTYPYSPRSLGR